MHQAPQFLRAVDDLPIMAIEQPCRSLFECGQIVNQARIPLILDESITTMDDLMNARHVVGAGGVNLKPGPIGGLTKTRSLKTPRKNLEWR